MAELIYAEKKVSDWFPERSKVFSIRTAKMDRSRKDLTKSCFGKILEERTVLYEVGTLFLLSCL